jgi:hypothetical protein
MNPGHLTSRSTRTPAKPAPVSSDVISMLLRILNGTARLFILMVFLSWIGMAVHEWNDWSDLQEMSVESKIDAVSVSESGERRLNRDSWPVVAAQPSFIDASVKRECS